MAAKRTRKAAPPLIEPLVGAELRAALDRCATKAEQTALLRAEGAKMREKLYRQIPALRPKAAQAIEPRVGLKQVRAMIEMLQSYAGGDDYEQAPMNGDKLYWYCDAMLYSIDRVDAAMHGTAD